MDIKVSVIMAVYNAERYLHQAINSILSQTLEDIEIILVDDGSSDDSMRILCEYEEMDGRVRVYQNIEESDGAASARNLGLSKAQGEYLSIVDSDDFFELDMLENAYERAKREQADVVIFDGYRYDDRNQVDLERNTILVRDMVPSGRLYVSFSPQENADDLFRMTLGAAWNCLFSTEHVNQHNLKFAPFHHADDLEFVYMAFALSKKIAILPKRLVHYRVNHAGTQASMVSLWPETAWQAMLSFKEHLIRAGIFDIYRVAFIRVAMKYQLFYLDTMKDAGSFHKLYEDLHTVKLQELGIADATPEEIGNDIFTEQRDIILKEEADGYLFAKQHQLAPFDEAVSWKTRIPKGSRLVVYGADRLGVDVIHSILWNQDYKLVSWTDEQYESLGFPVTSPEILNERLLENMMSEVSNLTQVRLHSFEYDFILIVSRSQEIFDTRKKMLMRMGIAEDKIRWQNE